MTKNNNQKDIPLIQDNPSQQSMTIVLAAPSIHDEYYGDYFNEIVRFQKNYAERVLEANADTVRIIVDADTKKYYSDTLAEHILIESDVYHRHHILIESDVYDIWIGCL